MIRGRIVAADSGRPFRRAEIRISAPEAGREPRTTSTDADGRYEFAELPAGRYTMLVRRRGFLPLRYGQRRPLEQGKPLDVLDRQVVDDLDFAMPRMSTIRVTRVTGQVVDGKGAASADGTVIVFSSETEKWFQDSRFVGAARPDQQGVFEVKGLPPGDYLAVAVDYVQDGMWNDPEFLESTRHDAQKLTLVDGRSQAIQLKLVAR